MTAKAVDVVGVEEVGGAGVVGLDEAVGFCREYPKRA